MNVRIVKSTRGSYRWYAVPANQPDDHPTLAVWGETGVREVETSFGKLTTDGGARFFQTRTKLKAALTLAGFTAVS